MNTFRLSAITVALIGLVGCGSDCGDGKQSTTQFSQFSTQWNSYYIGHSSSLDPDLKQTVDNLNADVQGWLTTYPLYQDGVWLGVSLNTRSSAPGSSINSAYQRLLTMARVYNIYGGALYQDEDLKQAILASLDILGRYYSENTTPAESDNWWNWQIGIPKTANTILLLMGEHVEQSVLTHYHNATKHFVPHPDQIMVGGKAKPATGANLIDVAQVVLLRGVLSDDLNEFHRAVEAIVPVLDVVESGDGFYRDGSFIQHEDIPYTGTYGNELIKGLGMIIGAVKATDIQTENLDGIYPILLNSFAPLMVDGRMMDFVNGRAISRQSGQTHKVGHAVINSMLSYVETAPSEFKQPLKAFIKQQINSDSQHDLSEFGLAFGHYQLAKEILVDSTIQVATNRDSHKQFPSMDRVVHHRDDYTFGIAMHSSRVGNYEYMGNENKKGWYTGDGVTYLYNQQDHYTNYWVTVDSTKLPGTTVVPEDLSAGDGQRSQQSGGRQTDIQWAGGTQLHQYGAAGFDFTNHDGALKAKKSWFMFDDEIVALGSNIENTNAYTVIENRKINATDDLYLNDERHDSSDALVGSVAKVEIKIDSQANPMTYLLLGDVEQEVSVSKQCSRSGNWSEVGTGNGDVENTCFVEATISHGINDTYQYVILPNTKVDTDYISPISVIRNDAVAHSVKHAELSITSANFWAAGIAGIIEAKTPMSILIQDLGEQYAVSISDPTRSPTPVEFKITGTSQVIEDKNQRVTTSHGIHSVDLSELAGESYTFKMSKVSL